MGWGWGLLSGAVWKMTSSVLFCSVLFCPHLAGGVPGCCEGVLLLSKKINYYYFSPSASWSFFLLGQGRGVPEASPPPPPLPDHRCMCNFCHNYQQLQEELIGPHTQDQMFQLRIFLIISLPRLQFLLLHLLICLHNTLVMKIQGLVSNITCIQP